MAIPTYQRQPQGLGGTVKLSGSDPVNKALQDLGGQMQNLGGALKQFEQVKDEGFKSQAAVDRQIVMNHANQDFDGLLQSGQITIEEKPDFMRERIDNWESEVRENWKGTDSALEDFMTKSSLVREQEQGKYMGEVATFQAERAVVSMETAYSNAVYSQDQATAEYYGGILENVSTPKRVAQLRGDAEKSRAYNSYANIDSIKGLDDANALMESGEAWNGFDYVGEDDRARISKANRRQRDALITARNQQQRDNALEGYVMLEQGQLSYEAIIMGEMAGQNYDSTTDNAGFGEKDAMVMRRKFEKQIGAAMPSKAKKRFKEFVADVKQDWAGYGAIESENDLDEFKADVLKMDLDPDQEAYMFYTASKIYNLTRNPKIYKPVADAVTELTRKEADIIALGGSVNLGEQGYALTTQIDKNSPADEVYRLVEERSKALDKDYTEVIQTRLRMRNVSNPETFDPATAPAGTQRKDDNGVLWIKREDGQWESE